MSDLVAKPVKFSDCHGSNVVIKAKGTFAQGQYIKAQGQFISATHLIRDKPFCIMFNGTGIVKFNTFPNKAQAVDWVRSKQPLPHGCRRIRLAGNFQYTVSIPNPGKCVLVETLRNSKREFFTLDAGPRTTLAFDIECGDIVVSIGTTPSNLTFDTFCCSPHIDISKSQGITSATLTHYNPSSLCCLENSPLTPGSVFVLEANSCGSSKDSGSYIRVCVAKQLSPYENDGQTICCGSSTHPCYKGKRIMIPYNSYEKLIVHIVPEGLRTDRGSTRGLDRIYFPFQGYEQTLWFELHKVSLKVWQMIDGDNTEPEQPFITFDIDYDDPPPDELAPLPPNTLPKAKIPRQRSHRKMKHVHARSHRQPELAGLYNIGYVSETSSSDPRDVNPTAFERNYSSRVSADRLSSSTWRNSATYPKFTSMPISLSSNSTLKMDLLCDRYVDSTPLASTGGDLITLSSLESLNVVNDQADPYYQKMKHYPRKSYYEKPDPIWSTTNSTISSIPSFLKAIACNRTIPGDPSPAQTVKESCTPPQTASQKSLLSLTNANQSLGANGNSSSGSGFVTAMPQDRRDTPQSLLKPFGVNRNEMCQDWVKKVNDCQHIWSPHENGLKDYPQAHQEQDEQEACDCTQHESNGRSSVMYRQAFDSKVPTSSFWIVDNDDVDSVRHDLDIQIVEVEGKLRCHSFHSDSINSVTDSRIIPAYLRNGPTDSRNSPGCLIHHSPDSRNNSVYSQNGPTDARNGLSCLHNPSSDSRENDGDSRKGDSESKESLASLSSTPNFYLKSIDKRSEKHQTVLKASEKHETVLKAAYFETEDDFSHVKSETRRKSIDSCGFIVEEGENLDTSSESSEASDDITHLKKIAQRENRDVTETSESQQESDATNEGSSSLPPKPCKQHSVAQYYLANPISPVPQRKEFTGSRSNLLDLNANQFQYKCSDTDEESCDNGDDQSTDDFPETSCGTLTLTHGSDKENELNEQINDSDSGVVCMRKHLREDNRNIIESVISNGSTAYVSIGPTVTLRIDADNLPDTDRPIKRSETLKRNLDTSPRPSIRKACGSKVISTDCSKRDRFSDLIRSINELANK